MTRTRFGIFLSIVFLFAIVLTNQAKALGTNFIDQVISPIGLTCNFNPYNDPGFQEAQVNMTIAGSPVSGSSGMNYWFSNSVTGWPRDILAADIAANCGVTNVTNFVSDGADGGSYAADTFMGVQFRATVGGSTYDYVLGITGATNTAIVNTRSVVTNTVPTANAGADQSVASGAAVVLDGSASDGNDPGETLSYAWTQTAGTTVTLANGTTAMPSFTAPTLVPGAANQTLTFSLIVNDGQAPSVADTVDITVSAPANVVPTADAGADASVASAATVNLDGSGSTANNAGQTLTYTWTQSSGTSVSLTGSTSATPSFTAPTLVPGAANSTLVFSLVVNDGIANSAADTVSITVTAPPNTPATADAGADANVASAASVSLSGAGSNANDAGQSLTYAWTQSSGTTVTLTGATSAAPNFTAPTLVAGSLDAVLVFSLTVNDGIADSAPDTVSITVQAPANTPATADAGPDASVASAASVSLSGAGSNANDAGQSLTYAWTQSSGTSVTLTGSATAAPSFTAPTLIAGAADAVLVFSLIVNDGVADSAADTVSITVQAPANTPATANAGADASVASAASVTLDGSGSNANDAGQTLTYAWTQTAGTSVTLTGAATAAPSFPAPTLAIGAANQTLTFSLVVNDGVADSLADTVDVIVTAPPNTAATADAGVDASVASGATASLDGSGSNANDAGQTLTYAWTQTAGTSVTLTGGATASPSFTAPTLIAGTANVALTFSLIVNDGIADSVADTVTITVTAPANTPATANAGPDASVASAGTGTLDGSGSSANDAGQTLTYAWTQTSGTSVALTGAATASPSFTAPTLIAGAADTTLTFSLTVNDGIAPPVADTVSITVTAPANTPATADAGADAVVGSAGTVTLDGSVSSANDAGQTLTYAWTQTNGTTVVLTGASTVSPSFTAPNLAIGDPDLTLVFSLTVNDGVANSAADTVTITVQAGANTAATANAGPDASVGSAAAVTLDGAGSNANDAGQTLTYAWTQTAGTTVALTGNTTVAPSFTAPTLIAGAADEALTFSLIVNDGIANSVADTVTITVQASANTAPTADAGADAAIGSGAAVTLDGSGSSANDAGQTLTYAWTQTAGSSVTLTGGTTAAPSFTAPTLAVGDADATLVFSLIVNDGIANSVADTVTITVQASANTAPTADAGADAAVGSGAAVTLDGSGSNANDTGQTLTYAWSQTAGPSVTLTGGTTVAPSFTAPTLAVGDADTTLVFSLIVNDGIANSVADTVTITVQSVTNNAPTADAGTDAAVNSAALVSLDGSGSNANDVGQSLTYAWTQTSGQGVTLTGADGASPSFTAPTLAIGAADVQLVFSLTVNDGIAASSADTVAITVRATVNTAATADAGADLTGASGDLVNLDGTGSSANDSGQTLTYAWTQTSGVSVTLAGAGSATPSFTAPTLVSGDDDLTLAFSLIVTDGFGDSVADTVEVIIQASAVLVRPTVSLSNVPDVHDGASSFAIQIAFSAPVTGFEAADLVITNGEVVSLTGSGSAYTARLRPLVATKSVTASVSEEGAQASNGLGNTASEVVVIAANVVEIARDEAAKFSQQRGRLLARAQPRLSKFLARSGGGHLNANATASRADLSFATGNGRRVWAEAMGLWSREGTTEQSYAHLSFGAHVVMSENMVAGVMAQFDRAEADLENGHIESAGYLIGPYVVVRLPEQPLVFSASYLKGMSTNQLTLTGLATDSFDSERTLMTFGIEGSIETGSGVVLIPSVDFLYYADQQQAYVDSQGNDVDAQLIEQVDTRIGLRAEIPFDLGNSQLLLLPGVDMTFGRSTTDDKVSKTQEIGVSLGAVIELNETSKVIVDTFYSGIGNDESETYGGSIVYEMTF